MNILKNKGEGREEGITEDGWTELGMISERERVKGLSAKEVYDRATWKRVSSYIHPT